MDMRRTKFKKGHCCPLEIKNRIMESSVSLLRVKSKRLASLSHFLRERQGEGSGVGGVGPQVLTAYKYRPVF